MLDSGAREEEREWDGATRRRRKRTPSAPRARAPSACTRSSTTREREHERRGHEKRRVRIGDDREHRERPPTASDASARRRSPKIAANASVERELPRRVERVRVHARRREDERQRRDEARPRREPSPKRAIDKYRERHVEDERREHQDERRRPEDAKEERGPGRVRRRLVVLPHKNGDHSLWRTWRACSPTIAASEFVPAALTSAGRRVANESATSAMQAERCELRTSESVTCASAATPACRLRRNWLARPAEHRGELLRHEPVGLGRGEQARVRGAA